MSAPGPEILEGHSSQDLGRQLGGRTLEVTRRQGQHLFAGIGDEGWLRFHLGTTGSLHYFRTPGGAPDHVCLTAESTTAAATNPPRDRPAR